MDDNPVFVNALLLSVEKKKNVDNSFDELLNRIREKITKKDRKQALETCNYGCLLVFFYTYYIPNRQSFLFVGCMRQALIIPFEKEYFFKEKIFGVEKMAPSYKLTYFPVAALGEPIRFLFSYGGIEFEDFRFEREDWPQIKPNMPFGQVPVLEHDGKLAHQSVAIARYVAKKVKLVGNNEWEDLEIDAMVDTINDLRSKIALYHYETDAAIKESRKEPLFKETLPFYLQRLDTIVKENNGYLALGRLTWADMFFVALLKYLNAMCGTDIIADYPNLIQLKDTVLALPAIKEWVEKRPQSEV